MTMAGAAPSGDTLEKLRFLTPQVRIMNKVHGSTPPPNLQGLMMPFSYTDATASLASQRADWYSQLCL